MLLHYVEWDRIVCKLLKKNKLWTKPYHPEANGQVENFNGVLKKMQRAMRKKNHQTWKNLSHASSSLTEKFQARQPVFLLLNYSVRDILRDHLLFLNGNGKNQLYVLSYSLDSGSKLNSMTD